MIWGSKKVLSSTSGQVGFLAGPRKSSSNKVINGNEQEVSATWTCWDLSSDGFKFIGKQTSKYISVYCMHLLLPFKLFL